MVTIDDLGTLVDQAVHYGKDKTDAIIARAVLASDSQTRFSQSAIDITKHWESVRLELFVLVKSAKTGASVRSVSSKEEVKKAVDDVVAFTEMLPDSMFFAGLETQTTEFEELKDCFDPKMDTFVEESSETISSIIDSAISNGAKRVAGSLMVTKRHLFFRSSLGPEGSTKRTGFELNVRALQNELDYSGQGLHSGTMPSSAEREMVAAGANAGKLSKEAIGAVQGEPGVYDLILSPTVAADVIGDVPNRANPFIIMMGMSPLQDKMGEQIAPEFITAHEDPLLQGGILRTPFDWEGTVSRKTTIIEEGVLKSLLHNTTTAKMFETESTGSSRLASIGRGMRMLLPAPSNIVFENGNTKLEDMFDVDRPTIYVTCNWYKRFQNAMTGDFSTIPRDAMFLIENGERKPIKNMRISDNTMRMLANIDALGNDRTQVQWWEVRGPTLISSVRIRDCRMTAATQ
ncbi:TldD/PmbA family protein [Candidatus Thorarchaeota archaeon]|nr:MAG: TldD/PmbA family protein [Candidatus Thorarchaeota archaeon]